MIVTTETKILTIILQPDSEIAPTDTDIAPTGSEIAPTDLEIETAVS